MLIVSWMFRMYSGLLLPWFCVRIEIVIPWREFIDTIDLPVR